MKLFSLNLKSSKNSSISLKKVFPTFLYDCCSSRKIKKKFLTRDDS